MSTSAEIDLKSCIEQAYAAAHSCHGDLDYALEAFTDRLVSIADKNLGEASRQAATLRFLASLHTTDLYLAGACALSTERAWMRFVTNYQAYIQRLADFFFETDGSSKDLAGSILSDMFLPDSSGHSRIASYDGRSSLATWLRTIVKRRAINERERKWSGVERLDSQPELADSTAVHRVEASLRSGRYDSMVRDCFKCACDKLTERERLMLLWRYEEQLQVSQIARIFAVNPSTVTRQLEQVYRKLREEVVLMLASKHKLSAPAIKECLADILESPGSSLLVALKAR
ncbi:MAG TPA: sigma-70 family RNA polymerase sigma factor [Blastocatellia bacterium]|nr:sigma-70 family RNA polymerase sigma factor [Blastocatellia bacterium]